jgi:hypothetical protein
VEGGGGAAVEDPKDGTAKADLQRIIESAKRLGVELDESEAIQWLTAVSAAGTGGDVVVDTRSGVFGHKVSMLDFSPEELQYYREVGQIVELEDRPGVVETALALSGSSAQSKIQTYPGDCDYFERVNIHAETREEACRILADLMREKALKSMRGETFQLIEVKFGSYPDEVIREGKMFQAGAPISWQPEQVEAGYFKAQDRGGSAVKIRWEEVAASPGWCKMDWVVADPVRGQLANASNMLDATWEAPDGSITPLDGYLDPYFQEVYLEADSIPIFSKLARNVTPDALDDYVEQLEREVRKYVTHEVNYGKAAKRMYNVFRLTGRFEEAAFVRELFDEPATVLYQVWSLIRTIDDVVRGESDLPAETVIAEADRLILSVIEVLEGERETEIVRRLLRLKDSLARDEARDLWEERVDAARSEVINVVNNFFYSRLTAVPTIEDYIQRMKEAKRS